jgi:hypothetical protein
MSKAKKKQVEAQRKSDQSAQPLPIGNALHEVFSEMGSDRNFAKYGQRKKTTVKERVFTDSKGKFSEMNKSKSKKKRIAQ